MDRATAGFERDRALVQGMRVLGEPFQVIEDFLTCLDLTKDEHDELLRVARGELPVITGGDVIEMNPLTAQPQRSRPRY